MNDLIRREDVIKLVNQFVFGLCKAQNDEVIKIFNKYVEKIPTSYDIDKVVEKLEEVMQDLSVIEIFSHIDFDSTIQSGLDNFLKAYNSELLRIVKQGGVSDDVCEWKYNDSEYYFESSCKHLHIFMSDGPKENEYRFCPYCGKKIKVVE